MRRVPSAIMTASGWPRPSAAAAGDARRPGERAAEVLAAALGEGLVGPWRMPWVPM